MINKVLIFCSILLALTSYASAFFLSWGGSEQPTPQTTRYLYHKRLLQGPSYTIIDPEKRPPVPSVPVQVPLQAQLSPIHNVHNVQLVPCLCPVSPDAPYENQVPYENIYVHPNGQPLQHSVQQPLQQQVQQQYQQHQKK